MIDKKTEFKTIKSTKNSYFKIFVFALLNCSLINLESKSNINYAYVSKIRNNMHFKIKIEILA